MQIKHRFTGAVLFDAPDAQTLRDAVIAAVAVGANLTRANLYGANLYGANLTRANLYGANLTRANLTRANLYGANLDGANLYGANLTRANLYGAYLTGANLTRADLYGANLTGANLDGEVLTKAPISLVNLHRPVLITEGFMRIGCQRHTHAEWAAFDEGTIGDMSSEAPEFWAQWKAPLLALCAAHAAGGDAAQ